MNLIRMLFWMHFIAAVLVPFFLEWGRLRFAQILFLNAWFMLWMFLLEIPTGTIADLFSRKKSMFLACVFGIAAILVYLSHPHFGIFLLGEILFAVSFTLLSGADEAFIYDTLQALGQTKNSKKVFARWESFKLAGIIIGALAGSVMAKFWGVKMPLLCQIAPLGLTMILVLTLKEPQNLKSGNRDDYFSILSRGINYFIRHKILKILAFDLVSIAALTWLIIWFYQALLQAAGVDIIYFGAVHVLMCIVQIAIIENIRYLEKLLGGKKTLLFLSAILAGFFYIILGLTHSIALIIISIALCSGFGLARTPLFSNYMNKYIPSGERATILSIISMVKTLAIFVGNCLAGFLADWSLSYTMLIVGGSIISLSFLSKIKEEHLID